MKNIHCYLIVFMSFFLNESVSAQIDDKIEIGNNVEMHSNILDKKIKLSVHYPKDYNNSNKRYPVLYTFHSHFEMVSGITKNLYDWHLIPEIIIINIDNYEYNYLTPTSHDKDSTLKNADKFLQFFSDELLPYIELNYRTHPYRIVYSGALGGVFTLYSILANPTIFDAGIAPVPWIIYDEEKRYLISKTDSLLNINNYYNFLYITMDNEYELLQDLEELVSILRTNPKPGLEWEYHFWPEEDHYSAGPRTLYAGLRSLFKEWNTIPKTITQLNQIKLHEESLAQKFGYEIGISSKALWLLGQENIKNKRYNKAIEILKYRLEKQPNDAFVHLDLGIAYELDNQLEMAKKNYEQAYAIESVSSNSQRRYLIRIQNFLININKKINNAERNENYDSF